MDASIYIREELRPAIVEFKRPVCDEDGYQTHQEVVHLPVSVHTSRLAPQGRFVVEFEDGTCDVVEPQAVQFVDVAKGEEE